MEDGATRVLHTVSNDVVCCELFARPDAAGHFDMDAELLIWVSGSPQPIKKEFRRGTDIKGVQQMLAHYILAL